MAFNPLNKADFLLGASLGSNLTTDVFPFQFQDNLAIQLVWTGDPVGVFSIQTSVNHRQDANGNVQVIGDWVDLPIAPAITASGVPDSAIFDLNQLPESYVRLVYLRSSGTGLLNVYVGAKGV